MSNDSSVDRESFQKLLASAFALQQSQIDSQSLSAIVELERLIMRGELDLDGALPLIADRARNVANATGVAIGLLKGDQLVYRAGSGSAAAYIGKRVLATLTVSADRKVSGELLRVENAQTDPRIEAGVCRQFGAKSLLVLLIYQDRAVAGLLHVLFSEPHVFQDREVCIYRLMAGLIGEAMCRAAQLERGETVTAELPANPSAIEQITPETERVLIDVGSDVGSMEGPANQPAISEPCGAATTVTGELPVLEQPVVPATMIMQRAKRVPWHKSGAGGSCWCARDRLLDWLQRSPPKFGLRIFSAPEIDCHPATGTLSTGEDATGEDHVQASGHASSSGTDEACQHPPAGAGRGERGRVHRRRCDGAPFHDQTRAAPCADQRE